MRCLWPPRTAFDGFGATYDEIAKLPPADGPPLTRKALGLSDRLAALVAEIAPRLRKLGIVLEHSAARVQVPSEWNRPLRKRHLLR